MNLNDLMLRDQTRRHFFENCAVGAGAIGLASLLQSEQRAQASSGILGETHHPAKAKNVIYMFMAGGPSQLEMFDYKPKLQELEGKVIPESYVCLSEERCQAAGHPAEVQKVWGIGHRAVRCCPPPGQYRG